MVQANPRLRSHSLPFAFDTTLAEAVREQHGRIERQEATIEPLQGEIEVLKSALAQRDRDLRVRLAALEHKGRSRARRSGNTGR